MADGWWNNNGAIANCVLAYDPVSAADKAASYVNKYNPGTYDAALGVAPQWVPGLGWWFNGSTMYLSTGYTVAGAVSTLVRWGGFVVASDKIVFGARSPTSLEHICATSSRTYMYLGGTFCAVLPTVPGVSDAPATGGVTANAGRRAFYNGVYRTSSAVDPAPSSPLLIGCTNNAGTPAYFAPVSVQAVAVFSAALSDAEILTVTTAMRALPSFAAVAGGSPASGWSRFVGGGG